MELGEGPEQQPPFTVPNLTSAQLLAVVGAIGSALNLTFMQYGRTLGQERIHELEEFGQQLLTGIRNLEIGGMNMTSEPAVVETIYAFVSANIPKVKRIG